ncbi:hypothetical protein INT43_007592 [Umbelopsis isabellina]|uniref:Uncharacterized protein n=1 Tax=Mortierella isabellina TaxID=91625 RepID=A0A8H7PN92_MORIS|nr:hypothetical protein INT43_007592 [Umbelopsis isabellina]
MYRHNLSVSTARITTLDEDYLASVNDDVYDEKCDALQTLIEKGTSTMPKGRCNSKSRALGLHHSRNMD